MSGLDPEALAISAKASGMSEDEIERAVTTYRQTAKRLHEEPEWRAAMHMAGREFGLAQYTAEGTAVTMQVDSWKGRGDQWQQETSFVYRNKSYETFGEARAAELTEQGQDRTNVTDFSDLQRP